MNGIFSRITKAIRETPGARYVFLGTNEWAELQELCKTWGVEGVSMSTPGYDPASDESTRGEIHGCQIFRVDALAFLAVH